MNNPIKVYIAGPYTKPDPAVNTARAMNMWHTLRDYGFSPFCPHLSHFLHIHHERPYRDWMDYDLEWITCCDVLLRMEGESSGADEEVQFCKERNIPIVHGMNELIMFRTNLKVDNAS